MVIEMDELFKVDDNYNVQLHCTKDGINRIESSNNRADQARAEQSRAKRNENSIITVSKIFFTETLKKKTTYQSPQQSIIEYSNKKGIVKMSYNNLCSGVYLLTWSLHFWRWEASWLFSFGPAFIALLSLLLLLWLFASSSSSSVFTLHKANCPTRCDLATISTVIVVTVNIIIKYRIVTWVCACLIRFTLSLTVERTY